MEPQNLYFLAIVLPDVLQKDVIAVQKYLSDKFQTYAALKVMPHITLKSPFTAATSEHEKIVKWFKDLDLQIIPFDLTLQDYDTFPNPKSPVIFIKPLANTNLLSLQSQIVQKFRQEFPEMRLMELESTFRPHVTVAYRDLQTKLFVIAWEEFSQKSFDASFTVDHICLLRHDGKKWNIIGEKYF